RRVTYWLRFFLVLAALIIWLALLLAQRGQMGTVQRSQMLFHSLGVLALSASLVSGVFLTSDSLSEERREGTLGLLFLTDLKGYDVVLGKLAAQFIHLGCALVAIIPAAALPLLFGGVT